MGYLELSGERDKRWVYRPAKDEKPEAIREGWSKAISMNASRSSWLNYRTADPLPNVAPVEKPKAPKEEECCCGYAGCVDACLASGYVGQSKTPPMGTPTAASTYTPRTEKDWEYKPMAWLPYEGINPKKWPKTYMTLMMLYHMSDWTVNGRFNAGSYKEFK